MKIHKSSSRMMVCNRLVFDSTMLMLAKKITINKILRHGYGTEVAENYEGTAAINIHTQSGELPMAFMDAPR